MENNQTIYEIFEKTLNTLNGGLDRGIPPGKMIREIEIVNHCYSLMERLDHPRLEEASKSRELYFKRTRKIFVENEKKI